MFKLFQITYNNVPTYVFQISFMRLLSILTDQHKYDVVSIYYIISTILYLNYAPSM